MNVDDVVYLCLLFFSIGFGYYYRQIEDIKRKKNVGTAVGFMIVLAVSGIHIIHSIVFVLINALIILLVDKRKCHLISFTFSFLYLFFFRTTVYFGIPYPPAHTNLVLMMLTLKMVGLAFEVNTAYLAIKKDESEANLEKKLENESNNVKVDFLDTIHYAFNYVGVLTGPYYRYRTFIDSFNLPFTKHVNWKEATFKKLTFIPMYAILFLLGTYIWPLSYALSDEFYVERSWLYRFWYSWPTFFIFRMRIYIGLVLSECVCTVAGLGAYPEFSKPKSGLGPSSNFDQMKQICDNPIALSKEEYNFETIHNVNPYGADFCTTFRDGMKHWNICIQYWLAVNVYKRFPSKQFRTFATVLVSAAWHGVYSGYYVCIGCVPFVLPVEDLYVRLFLKNNTGTSLKIWEWIIWVFKMQSFSYFAVAFHLLEVNKIMHYYNSIYHCWVLVGIILYIVGLYLVKTRKSQSKRDGKETSRSEALKSD